VAPEINTLSHFSWSHSLAFGTDSSPDRLTNAEQQLVQHSQAAVLKTLSLINTARLSRRHGMAMHSRQALTPHPTGATASSLLMASVTGSLLVAYQPPWLASSSALPTARSRAVLRSIPWLLVGLVSHSVLET
jgi:hypothetical protein